MKKEVIVHLHASFEQCMRMETEGGTEFWLARDLQQLLGYSHWRNFEPVIEKATNACENAGFDPADHFAHTRKMVELGSGAERATGQRRAQSHRRLQGTRAVHGSDRDDQGSPLPVHLRAIDHAAGTPAVAGRIQSLAV